MFIMFYGAMLLVTVVFKKLRRRYGSESIVGSIFKLLKQKLVFSFIIQIFISAFMELLIAVYLNLKAQLFTRNGEILGVFFSYFCFVVILVVLPLLYLWVITRPFHLLEKPSFRERWGTFYAESRMTSRWNLYFNFVSLVRRFQFISFVLYVKIPAFQITSIMVTNTLVMIYQINFKPLKSPKDNILECFNEYMIFTMTILLVSYTEIVPDNITKYQMGFVHIYVFFIYLGVNITSIMAKLMKSLYLLYLKLKNRYG